MQAPARKGRVRLTEDGPAETEIPMGLRKYRPNAVLIPDDCPIRREFSAAGRTNVPPGAAELRDYDSRTVFYDVFRCDDGRTVTALGPRPLNLWSEVARMRIFCEGESLACRRELYGKTCAVTIPLGDDFRERNPLALEFVFPSFTARVEVPRPESYGAHASHVCLLTLQKDNPLPWIEEWCLWHARLHGISRIVIYDNGSRNLREVEVLLDGLGDDVDAVLVDWPFPYGPANRGRHRFCQEGALNHYRMLIGRSDAWCLNLDVDEYLVTNAEKTLRRRLKEYEKDAMSVVLVDSWIVPGFLGQPEVDLRRVGTYSVRERTPRGRGLKYLFRPREVRYNKVHAAWPRNRMFDVFVTFPRLHMRLMKFFCTYLFRRLAKHELLSRLYSKRVAVRYVLSDEMRFYHFRGLYTNWKPAVVNADREIRTPDPKRHVEDPRIRRLALRVKPGRAGVAAQPEEKRNARTARGGSRGGAAQDDPPPAGAAT